MKTRALFCTMIVAMMSVANVAKATDGDGATYTQIKRSCVRSNRSTPIEISLSVPARKIVFGKPIGAMIQVHVNAPSISLEMSDGGDYDFEARDAITGQRVQTPLKTISMIRIRKYEHGTDIVATPDLSKSLLIPRAGRYAIRVNRFVWRDTCYSSNEVVIDVVPSL